jgi:hypothetical protein
MEDKQEANSRVKEFYEVDELPQRVKMCKTCPSWPGMSGRSDRNMKANHTPHRCHETMNIICAGNLVNTKKGYRELSEQIYQGGFTR